MDVFGQSKIVFIFLLLFCLLLVFLIFYHNLQSISKVIQNLCIQFKKLDIIKILYPTINKSPMDPDHNQQPRNEETADTKSQQMKESQKDIQHDQKNSKEDLTQKQLIKQSQQKKTDQKKSDISQTLTKPEQTLTLNRDPVHPKESKPSASKDEENKPIEEILQQTKQKPKNSEEDSNSSPQRPITINLDKQAFTMQKVQNIALKEPEVKIEINEMFEKGFALNKQIYFRIIGFDKHGPIDIQRTVDQFQSLRKILLERWPGCFVPHISTKSQLRNQQLRNLHKRKNLQGFLKKLSYCEEIYYKQQIQLFLRSYGINIQQMFLQMPVLRVKDVIQRIKVCYGQQVQKQSTPQNASKISRFSTSLKKISANLNNLSRKCLKLAESYQQYQQSIPKFSKFLLHYEQSCLSQYTNNPTSTIALKSENGVLSKLSILAQKKNVFYDMYFLLESEARDAEALSEVILAMEMFNIKRDELESQIKTVRVDIEGISLGERNFKVMTSRKGKETVQAQLEHKQSNLIQERHTLIQLYGMAEIVLAVFTIPMFKKMKINNYFTVINDWMGVVGQTNSQIYQVWKYLNEQGSSHLKKQFEDKSH